MDYKEKYEKALAMAKGIHDDNPSSSTAITVCEQIFPELAESKDEKIRQFLIHEIEETSDKIMSYRGMNKESVIAWLEKQGEHAKFRDSIQVGDKVTRNEDGVLVNLSQLKRVAKKDEKQGEQKPANLPNGEDYGIDGLYHAISILEKTLGKVVGYQSDDGILEHKCAIEAVNHLYKQKPAWSEEDEKMLNDILMCGEHHCYLDAGNIAWLKSLKDRYAWKPSDEQMKALDIAIRCGIQLGSWEEISLKDLREQLKKLRKE